MTLPDQSLRQARLLMIDDQEANILVLEHVLRSAGYCDFKSLTDSRQALEVYRSFAPDLVLLDLRMPHLDGLAVLDLLRGEIAEGAYLPILMLTRDLTSEAKRHALANGAKDFLNKPFDTREVLLRIKNLLQTRFLHLQLQEQNQLLVVIKK
jgi:CheY-like chemotaxis protein